jgi:hypothetical protein
LIVGVHITFANLWSSGEDFAGFFVEECLLLNAEVRGDEIEVQVVTMADRINIVWSMPRRPYIEELAAVCYLSASSCADA